MTDTLPRSTTHGTPTRRHRDLGIPASWYRVAWSSEVRDDKVLELHYFGTDMICLRSPAGDARVFDAHCPHLGAHLGTACLSAGEISCPFHGWRWDTDGANTLIPYADNTSKLTLQRWPVDEVNGIVWVWFDPMGQPPTWRIPRFPQCDSDDYLDYFPDYCKVWRNVEVHPQQAVENTADPAHITFIHRAAEIPRIERAESEGHVFTVELRYVWGGDKPSTWLTPNGPIDGGLVAKSFGFGLIATTYFGIHPALQFTGVTPIDASGARSDLFSTIIGGKGNSGSLTDAEFATRLATHFFEQVEADLPIWARQTLIEHPPYPKLEARTYRDMRRWAASMYGEGPVDHV